jgi:hypothetical protein
MAVAYNNFSPQGPRRPQVGPQARPRVRVPMGGGPVGGGPMGGAPAVPRESRLNRAASGACRFVKPLVPYIKGAGAVGAALSAGSALVSDVGKTAENRTFPKAGAVADETRRLQGEADGFIDRETEGLKGALPYVGGLMTDIYDNTSELYNDIFPGQGPGIELAPGAVQGIADAKRKPDATSRGQSATGGSTSKYDDLLLNMLSGGGQGSQAPLAAPAPMAPQAPTNDSYFINNQTGAAPGEKQQFRDLPGTTLNASQPQQLPGGVQGQTPEYESPMVKAVDGLNLAQFDASKDSFGDILAKRFQNVNEGGKLLSAQAQMREQGEQRTRETEDRVFNADLLEQQQNSAYRDGNLALGRDQLIEQARSSDIGDIVSMRNTDVSAQGRGTKPMTAAEQVKNQDAQRELSYRQFPTAPSGFADAVPGLLAKGFTMEQVQDSFNYVSAAQAQSTGTSVEELDAANLYAAIAARLGVR